MSSPFSVLTEIGNEPKDSIDVDESFGVVTDSPEKHEQNGFEETSSPKPLDEPAELNLDEETPKTSEVPSYVVDETLASITALTNASTSAHASSSSPVERDPFAASPSPQVASPLLTQVPPSAKARASPAPVQEDQIPVAKAPRVLVIFHGEEQGPVARLASSVAQGVTIAGLECDVRHLPRSRILLKDPASGSTASSSAAAGATAPLQPGELEHYDGIIFGSSSTEGQLSGYIQGFLDDIKRSGLSMHGKVASAFVVDDCHDLGTHNPTQAFYLQLVGANFTVPTLVPTSDFVETTPFGVVANERSLSSAAGAATAQGTEIGNWVTRLAKSEQVETVLRRVAEIQSLMAPIAASRKQAKKADKAEKKDAKKEEKDEAKEAKKVEKKKRKQVDKQVKQRLHEVADASGSDADDESSDDAAAAELSQLRRIRQEISHLNQELDAKEEDLLGSDSDLEELRRKLRHATKSGDKKHRKAELKKEKKTNKKAEKKTKKDSKKDHDDDKEKKKKEKDPKKDKKDKKDKDDKDDKEKKKKKKKEKDPKKDKKDKKDKDGKDDKKKKEKKEKKHSDSEDDFGSDSSDDLSSLSSESSGLSNSDDSLSSYRRKHIKHSTRLHGPESSFRTGKDDDKESKRRKRVSWGPDSESQFETSGTQASTSASNASTSASKGASSTAASEDSSSLDHESYYKARRQAIRYERQRLKLLLKRKLQAENGLAGSSTEDSSSGSGSGSDSESGSDSGYEEDKKKSKKTKKPKKAKKAKKSHKKDHGRSHHHHHHRHHDHRQTSPERRSSLSHSQDRSWEASSSRAGDSTLDSSTGVSSTSASRNGRSSLDSSAVSTNSATSGTSRSSGNDAMINMLLDSMQDSSDSSSGSDSSDSSTASSSRSSKKDLAATAGVVELDRATVQRLVALAAKKDAKKDKKGKDKDKKGKDKDKKKKKKKDKKDKDKKKKKK